MLVTTEQITQAKHVLTPGGQFDYDLDAEHIEATEAPLISTAARLHCLRAAKPQDGEDTTGEVRATFEALERQLTDQIYALIEEHEQTEDDEDDEQDPDFDDVENYR